MRWLSLKPLMSVLYHARGIISLVLGVSVGVTRPLHHECHKQPFTRGNEFDTASLFKNFAYNLSIYQTFQITQKYS